MTFADKVKFVRMKLYLSQAQLAKEIGVSAYRLPPSIGGKAKDMSRNLHLLVDSTTSVKSTA